MRCSRMGIDCEYAASTTTVSLTPSPTSTEYSMAVTSAQSALDDYLGLDAIGSQGQSTGIHALRHFQTATCNTFVGAHLSKVMHTVVAKEIWSSPYLMHMVLAVSSGHQRRLLQTHGQKAQLRELGIVEASHWQDGLQLYQGELVRKDPPPGPARTDFDSMIAAMFLTTVFTFASEDGTLDIDSTTGDDDFGRILSPMASTVGFKALQATGTGLSSDSPWISVFHAAANSSGSSTIDEQGIKGLPPAFVQLCELDENSSSHDNSYHKILQHLTPLLKMKMDSRNTNKIFSFGGRLHATIRPLVEAKDIRTLLLLSWWLSLFRIADKWWTTGWARACCKSIVAHLTPIPDSRIQALLVFPASFGTADYSWIWRDGTE
jgi:hypothetical protein